MPLDQTALRANAARVAEGRAPLTLLRLTAVPPARLNRKGRLQVQGVFTDLQSRWIVGRPGERWKVWKRPGDARWRTRLAKAHKAELDALYVRTLAASLF